MWVDGNPVRVDGTTNTVDEKLAFEELDLSVASYYDGIEVIIDTYSGRSH